MRKLGFCLAVCLCLIATPVTVQATPVQTIENLQDVLIDSGNITSVDERIEALSPTVIQTHDFSAIARLVTGRYWRKFEEVQREQFVSVFTQLSVMTYAERFKSLATSKFSYVETLKQPRNSVKIVSTLELGPDAHFSEFNDKQLFIFEYILQQAKQTDDTQANEVWKIINVVVDGVSDLALKRSNYVSILNEQGFEGLIAELNNQIANIQGKSSKKLKPSK